MYTNELKKNFGRRCTGIKINGEYIQPVNKPSKKMRFCEAVNYSFDVPIQITSDNLGCPGARRSMGYNNNDIQLSGLIAENNGIPLLHVEESLMVIPRMDTEIFNVTMGMLNDMEKDVPPDMYIIYTKPEKVTKLMYQYARKNKKLSVPPVLFLSVCGNVFVNTFLNQTCSISFGCPESRVNGGINEDEVIVGIPYQHVEILIDQY